jgi:transketolase
MGVEPVAGKWREFGWETIEVDGHDVEGILLALHRATHINLFGRPTIIIAHTIKGKGVTWMELNPGWHSHPTNPDQTDKAIAEIEEYAKKGATLTWR